VLVKTAAGLTLRIATTSVRAMFPSTKNNHKDVATTQSKPHSSPEENLASSKNQRRSHREKKS